MEKLLIATQNEDKMNEFKTALEPLGYTLLSLNDVGYDEEIIEDGQTFFDNALKKAKTIAMHFQCQTIADDSGLIVGALPGELGVMSKRFSPQATYHDNNMLLLEKLKAKQNRSAYFVSVLVHYFPDGHFKSYEGRVYGHIAHDLVGDNGFGYDPLFIVDELGKRMAQLSPEEKNRISHRGRAIKLLAEDLLR